MDYSPSITGSFISKVRARQEYMENIRKPAETLMEELIDLLLPSSTPWSSSEQEGEETGTEIYLSDPVRYLRTCADGLMGCMVSPHFRWFAYQMGNKDLRENDEVRGWLQECEEQMYYVFKNSNFYSVLPPHFRYALGIGNSMLLRYENTMLGKQVFTCPHPRQNYWLEDLNGRTIPYHRLYKKTVAEILETFGPEKMSSKFKEAVKQGRLYEEFTILHCIYHKEDRIFDETDIKPNRPYMEFYVEYNASETGFSGIIRQAGYFTNPVAPWRLEKNDDEVYGRGIGHLALSDIRGANELRASVITGIHKEIDMPIIAPMSLRGLIQKNPGGETYIKDSLLAGNRIPVRDLYGRTINYASIKDFEERLAVGLREWFSVDYFLQLSNLAMQGSPPTATQILGMADEKAILLIGRVGRFDSDCFDGLMKSTFLSEFMAGRLPEPPGIIYQYGGSLPDIEYLGPLAQAQRRMHSVRANMSALTSVMPAFEAEPKAKYKIRWADFVEDCLEKGGFSQKLIVPKAEYEQIIQAIDKNEAQLQQLEMAEKLGKVIPALGKKVASSSPLAGMTK